MKVLIACEESQAVCKEFRKLGFEAYSCDIQECSGGHPEWHIKGDVIPLLKRKWDLIIAHPPCTYLAVCGARWAVNNPGCAGRAMGQMLKGERKMTTQDGEWIIDQDSPLLDQIAVEIPNHHYNPYMTLRELILEYMKNDSVARSLNMVKADIEMLLERLNDLKEGKE